MDAEPEANSRIAAMSRIISIHSFRGGTGKSNLTANVAALFASRGLRVGVVDTDIQSPGIHVLLGMDKDSVPHSLNDYLWGKCEIEQAAYNITSRLAATMSGTVFLIPSSIKASDIARVLHEGYDPGLLNDGFRRLIAVLRLDMLMIDTHPGLNEETLLAIAISDTLVIIMRPDQQDYQGTSVTVAVARRLGVPTMMLVVNNAWHTLDLAKVQQRVEQSYGCEVAAVLPHSDELMALASAGIFALRYPSHPLTDGFRQIATKLMAV